MLLVARGSGDNSAPTVALVLLMVVRPLKQTLKQLPKHLVPKVWFLLTILMTHVVIARRSCAGMQSGEYVLKTLVQVAQNMMQERVVVLVPMG